MTELEAVIETKLLDALSPERMELFNDSHRHVRPGDDSHFRLIVVSEAFEGRPLVARQRLVFAALATELAGPIHALQMRCLTPTEYEAAEGEVRLVAPRCKNSPSA